MLRSQADERVASPREVLSHVATNVRRIRQERGLSQARLAELSGISRRMIVSIEGGEANVSLSTLDRIAAALDTRFSEVIRPADASDSRRIESLAWYGPQAESQAVLLGAAPASCEVELWLWSLGEGERYPSEAGSSNWNEMLFVIEGLLVVEAPDGRHELGVGDFLIFSSAGPYIFSNGGDGIVRFIRNVVL